MSTELLEELENKGLNPIAQGFLDRIVLALDTEAAYGNMGAWVEKNTRLEGRKFSFKDHEFQKAIINDTSRRMVIRKCSQVGLSELSARLIIGLAATAKDSNFIYVMPTSTFAAKFSTMRIQPIIDGSEVVKAMTDSASSKSKELKMIGTSFLYMGGTAGTGSGAISVPAKRVIFDEYDFCNMRVAGMYESRLKHAPECPVTALKGWISWFSTPTLPGYGVDLHFQNSDQKHYNVTCDGCHHQFAPDYFENIVIPGTPRGFKIKELTPEDVKADRYRFSESYIACPKCGKNVWEELCDPDKREWVAKYPGRQISGWQVHPWDCPNINSIPSIFQTMPGYNTMADYYNYTVGIPYEDKTNTFSVGPILGNEHRCVWNPHGGSGYFMGVDVGRTSNIIIGKPRKVNHVALENVYEIEAHYFERFKISKDKTLVQRLSELMKLFRVKCAVIDAQPEFSTVNALAAMFPGKVFGCEYQESRPADQTATKDSKELSNIKVIEKASIVKAFRTGTFDSLMKMQNSGRISYPVIIGEEVDREMRECAENFKNLKKVRKIDDKGEVKESYVKLDGNDHYLHAMNYLNMAVEIKGVVGLSSVVASPVGITTFKPNANAKPLPGIVIGSSSFNPMRRQ